MRRTPLTTILKLPHNASDDEILAKIKAITPALQTTLASTLKLPAGASEDEILKAVNANQEAAERSGWTIDDYLMKDPEALERMSVENPARFIALNDNYFAEKLPPEKQMTPSYKEALDDKRQLKQVYQWLNDLTDEEREDFKHKFPEEYAEIMKRGKSL